MPSLGQIAKRLRIKTVVSRYFGDEAYVTMRHHGLRIQNKLQRSRTVYSQTTVNKPSDVKLKRHAKSEGLRWSSIEPILPQDAYTDNFLLVADALDQAKIDWWVVKGLHAGRYVLGVSQVDISNVLMAIQNTPTAEESPVYVMDAQGRNPQIEASRIETVPNLNDAEILRVVSPKRTAIDGRKYGFAYGCDIEFWKLPSADNGELIVQAPRENQAARILSVEDFAFSEITVGNRKAKTPTVFLKDFLEEVSFEIDAVYTWVDGDDPAWQESRLRLQAEMSGEEFHPEAVHTARFRSRDELKYSLRSLQYNAPWFRNIYIVTADQVPDWLDTSHPKIHVVSHSEIFEPQDLPSFNSNAIISRLHHVPGLAEHFVYINDDVLFGRPVTKEQFFTSGGLALVSPSNNRRPFGPANIEDGPHFNITRNIRDLIEKEFGKVVSRAIKHTPHPMIKSVHFDMETRFKESYIETCSSRFRHHSDIVADQLHHYYAQIIGKAVPGTLTYNYINILDDKYSTVLIETMKNKDRDAFCINDAPVPGANPIDDDVISEFFETYFPIKSEFEL